MNPKSNHPGVSPCDFDACLDSIDPNLRNTILNELELLAAQTEAIANFHAFAEDPSTKFYDACRDMDGDSTSTGN